MPQYIKSWLTYENNQEWTISSCPLFWCNSFDFFWIFFSISGQKIMHSNLVPFSKIGIEGLHIIFIPNNCNMCGRSKLYHEKIPLWKRPEKLFHWQSVHFSEPFLWENFAQNQTNTECTNGSDIFGIWFLGKWCSTSRICPGKWVSDTQALRQVEQHRKDRRTEIRMCRKESGFRSSTSPSSRLPCGRTGQSSSRGARSRHRRRARFPWWAWLWRSCRGR